MLFLLLPSAVSFAHSTKEHHQDDCCVDNSDTHVHEKELDCCLCHVTIKNNSGVFIPTKEILFISYQDIPEKTILKHMVYTSVYHTAESRGPPVC